MTDESRGTDADDDAPLARVRRAKAAQAASETARRVDGGAVAVGLVVALGAKLATAFIFLLRPPSAVARIVAVIGTLTIPVGSYLAGRYAGGHRLRAALHGAFVAGATLSMTVLATVAVVERRPFAAVGEALVGGAMGDTLFVTVGVALVVVGAGAGAAGSR